MTDSALLGSRHLKSALPLLTVLVLLASALQLQTTVVTPSSPVRAASSDPVIAAAGDIACDPADPNFQGGNGTATRCRQKFTSDLLANENLAAVLTLGDTQYYCGGYQAYVQSYHLSWGRVKSITKPVVGNHEYLTVGGTDCTAANAGAAGYFNYFGEAAGAPRQGYYSYDIGAWHLIALNSNCGDVGGCSSDSPQYQWLQSDLAAHHSQCLLAYWHIPLFSSGGRAADNTRAFWQLLHSAKADVILNGHDHIYERFAPQDPNGLADPINGIREFIVGTGGAFHTSIRASGPMTNSEVINTDTYGVLKLTLHPLGYDWKFVSEAGRTFTDSGTNQCHNFGGSIDITPPTAPTELTAQVMSSPQVSLSWKAATDDIGVTSYTVFRNGEPIAITNDTSYSDTLVQPNTQYSYTVVAHDAAGNTSPPSNMATATTPKTIMPYRIYMPLVSK